MVCQHNVLSLCSFVESHITVIIEIVRVKDPLLSFVEVWTRRVTASVRQQNMWLYFAIYISVNAHVAMEDYWYIYIYTHTHTHTHTYTYARKYARYQSRFQYMSVWKYARYHSQFVYMSAWKYAIYQSQLVYMSAWKYARDISHNLYLCMPESIPDISHCSVGFYMPSTYHSLCRTYLCYLLFSM
jgi:hypothetical protein